MPRHEISPRHHEAILGSDLFKGWGIYTYMQL